MLTDHLSET